MVSLFLSLLFILPFVSSAEISAIDDTILARLEKLEKLYENFEQLLDETKHGLQSIKNKTETRIVQDTLERPKDLSRPRPVRQVTVATAPPVPATTSRPVTPVVFHARLTSSFSVMSPQQIVIFNNAITNEGNGYDRNFGAFKAPISGLYEFIATVSAYNNYFVDVEMVKNNQMLCRAHAASPDMEIGTCVAMVHLSEGDDVFVRHYRGHGTYLYGGYAYPSFSGHLISADS